MMGLFDDVKFIEDEVMKCMACGNCQEVCPIYFETKEEGSVARGKIKLVQALLNGLITGDEKGLKHHLEHCLTCRACNEICPCGVEIDKIVLAGRAAVVRQQGMHPLKKVIFNVVDRPFLMDTGMQLGSTFQGVVFKKEKESGSYTPRFPFGLDMKRIVPDLADKPFRKTIPEVNKPLGSVKYKVAYFTGCSANYIYDNISRAFMNIMAHNNVEVIVPKGQHCCGTPILSHGHQEMAKEMAIDHVKLFNKLDVDYILTVCGSCALSLKEHYLDLLEGSEYYEMAKRVSSKVRDWSDFLMNVIKPDLSALHNSHEIMTYHDPCHLRRGIGVIEEPRNILKSLPDVDFVEMARPNRCCGSAGSFSLTHYDLSMDIQNEKFEDIKKTKADTIVTGCGSCMMQLSDGQKRFGGQAKVKHTIEVLNEAYIENDRQKRIEKLKVER